VSSGKPVHIKSQTITNITPTCHYNYYFENGPDIEKCPEKCEQRMQEWIEKK
jgi:hypothetical protein